MPAKKSSLVRDPVDIVEELSWAYEDLKLADPKSPYLKLIADACHEMILRGPVGHKLRENFAKWNPNWEFKGLWHFKTGKQLWTLPEIIECFDQLRDENTELQNFNSRTSTFCAGEESGRKIFNDRMEALEAEHELRCGALMEQLNKAKKAATVVHHGRMLTAESMARELTEKDAQIASLKAKNERILQELNQQGKREQADRELRELVQCQQVFAMATLATNTKPPEDDRCLHVDIGPNGTTVRDRTNLEKALGMPYGRI